jgi:hypothetical protein
MRRLHFFTIVLMGMVYRVMVQIDFANVYMVVLGHTPGKTKIQPGAVDRQKHGH